MKECMMVFVGSGIGGVLRYLLSAAVQRNFSMGNYPLGTMVVNMAGCLLIGLLSGLVAKGIVDNNCRLLLVVGLCGGFTTFSTFANENLQLMRGMSCTTSALYIILSIVLGITFAWLGNMISKLF